MVLPRHIKSENGEIVCCCLAAALMRCNDDCDIVTAKIDKLQGSEWCMKHNKEVKSWTFHAAAVSIILKYHTHYPFLSLKKPAPYHTNTDETL